MENQLKIPNSPVRAYLPGTMQVPTSSSVFDAQGGLWQPIETAFGRWSKYYLSIGTPGINNPTAIGDFITISPSNVFEAAKAYKLQAKLVVSHLLEIYFRANRALIESLYLDETPGAELHYSIVLKDDTDENRATIFLILDEPEFTPISADYPIYFQFYPQRLKDKIHAKQINL